MRIGIVGLGLIGGSLAKSIKTKTQHTVAAVDLNSDTMMMARLSGAIDEALNEENLPQCDMVLLAVVPSAAVRWVSENGRFIAKSATVIDMCGVKRTVCEKIRPMAQEYGFCYVGGHPMAGTERGGFASSDAELFNGASMIVTPDENVHIDELEKIKAFFTDIGFASLTFSTPEEHDRIIAYTSQLAHITSSAYVKAPDAQLRRGFSAGSFNDMTRVARLDEDMWTELFMENRDYLAEQIQVLINNLRQYYDAVSAGDPDTLKQLLKDGKEKKLSAGGH
ncbi:MAG: prephenate dehydrogenase [Ruminococcaceae bacterium]|nr:prephenate dehydrogenase [Oscillospiraceae bacterium]